MEDESGGRAKVQCMLGLFEKKRRGLDLEGVLKVKLVHPNP